MVLGIVFGKRTTCAKADWLVQHGAKYLQPEKRRSALMLSYKRSELHYEPLGVVAAIVSWNYRTLSSHTHLFFRFNLSVHLKRCTIYYLLFLPLFSPAMPLWSSARNTSPGRHNGLLAPFGNVLLLVAGTQRSYRYCASSDPTNLVN